MKRTLKIALVAALAFASCAAPKPTDEQFLEAVGRGNLDTVKMMIKNGANLQAKTAVEDTPYGKVGEYSPLHIAAAYGNVPVAKELVEAGLDVNSKDMNGANALMQTVQNFQTDMVQYLVDAGIDINNQDAEGWTPLMMAAVVGNPEAMQIFLNTGKAQADLQDKEGWTALAYAATSGDAQVAKMLIDAGADVNKKGSTGGTAIVFAANINSNEMVNLLLEAGADPNVNETDSPTPLKMAQERKNDDMIKALRDHGAK